MDFVEKNKIPLAVLAGATIIGVFVYLFSPSPTPIQQVTRILSPTPTLIPQATPTVDETAAIKQAMLQKLGKDESRVEVTISQKTESHAKGSVREKEAVGGGYFLAAKTTSGWVIVYDGQAQPTCSQIASYNFPKTMVPECLSSSGKVITR